jgi:hypothetical protein
MNLIVLLKEAECWERWRECINAIRYKRESPLRTSETHTGELPIIGVNTFLDKKGSPTILPNEVIRSTKEEKEQQIANLNAFHARNKNKSEEMLKRLQDVAINSGNLFEELMETVKYCSLGQITHALYEVGGQYRRSMCYFLKGPTSRYGIPFLGKLILRSDLLAILALLQVERRLIYTASGKPLTLGANVNNKKTSLITRNTTILFSCHL